MQFGLFANFENPAQNAWSPARALAESVENVRHAETLGYSEAWITEHHFNPFSVSAAIFPLLAHLAGVTSSIRLGSAAVLLPMLNLVAAGYGVAIVPEAMKTLAPPGVTYVPLRDGEGHTSSALVLPQSPTPLAQKFAALVLNSPPVP